MDRIPYCFVMANDPAVKQNDNPIGVKDNCKCPIGVDTVLFYSGTVSNKYSYFRCIRCVTARQVQNMKTKGLSKEGTSQIQTTRDIVGFDQLSKANQEIVSKKLDPWFNQSSSSEIQTRNKRANSSETPSSVQDLGDPPSFDSPPTKRPAVAQDVVAYITTVLQNSDPLVQFLNANLVEKDQVKRLEKKVERLETELAEKTDSIEYLDSMLSEKKEEIQRLKDAYVKLVKKNIHP
jgi:uncharacterized coiled-coil protein SlyX